MFARLAKSMYLCTRKTKNALLEDPLAQLVEHNTFNVGVLGSSPKRITIEECLRTSRFNGALPFLAEIYQLKKRLYILKFDAKRVSIEYPLI